MRWFWNASLILALIGGNVGCSSDGKEALIPVTGTILVDDQPADGAIVTFVPAEGTPGNGGSGAADSTGKYEIQTPQGKKGLPAGKYKVAISFRRNPDGSKPDPNAPPIESNARELLSPEQSDPAQTKLTATVTSDGKPIDFALKSAKGKK